MGMKVNEKKGEVSQFQSRCHNISIFCFKFSLKVLDDYQLDGQAVHQQEASFRISESDPLGEFSMFRVFRADPGAENTFRSSSEESGEDLSPLLSKVRKL